MRGHFVGLNVTEYNGFKALKWPNGILYFDVEQDEDGGSGTVPANIHESGTAAVFSRALSSKKPFKTEDDLQKDEDLNKELKIIFGKKWEHRIGDWIHSYYEQQQAALQEYSKPSWEEFKHGDGSFTEFFRDHMDKLHRDLNPVIKVGIYERWNPSDLWAVKRNKMDKIKKELEKQISPQTVLAELNSILIGLMENNDLVGISLKKIEKKQSGHIRLYNVDTSAALKALNSYANLETFTMNDISFEPDNILLAKNVTTYVRIGARGKYAVSITRSGNNISFTSQIKGTAAQGGQAPLELVVKLLNAKEFNPSHNFYPKDEDAFVKQTTKYKKLYTKVAQFASSRSQRMKFED